MESDPFGRLRPAVDAEHAIWIVDALAPPPGVSFRVPDLAWAIARVHHPLADGSRWSDVMPELFEQAGEPDPDPRELDAEEGCLSDSVVDWLVPQLAAASETPHSCHYGLWTGWGEFHPGGVKVLVLHRRWWQPWTRWQAGRAGRTAQQDLDERTVAAQRFLERCPTIRWWGGRDMWLFDGDVGAVADIGVGDSSLHWGGRRRRSPQWWWPTDRSWFIASEIDDPWTYVAGPQELIEAVVANPDLDAVRLR